MTNEFKVGDRVSINVKGGHIQFPSIILALFKNSNGVNFAVCENDSQYNQGELKTIRVSKLCKIVSLHYKSAKDLHEDWRQQEISRLYGYKEPTCSCCKHTKFGC